MANAMLEVKKIEAQSFENEKAMSAVLMNITEIHKLAEKQKWMNRFLSSYSGSTRGANGDYYGTNVRFFLATNEEKSLGFVRINDKSSKFNNECPFPVWNLTDGYVKLPYRSNSVLAQLIKYVVKECDVRMMYIETVRFLKNRRYYQSLGFNNYYTVQNGELTWAFQDDVWLYVVERNEQRNQTKSNALSFSLCH